MRIWVALFLAQVLSIGFITNAEAQSYRHSADFTQQIVYLSGDVAIIKSIGSGEESEFKIYYEFVIAKWAGEPELGSFTGDEIVRHIIKSPISAWMSKDNKHVVGKFREFDFAKKEEKIRFFSIEIASGKLNNYESSKDLKKYEPFPDDLVGQSVDAFFDSMKHKVLKLD